MLCFLIYLLFSRQFAFLIYIIIYFFGMHVRTVRTVRTVSDAPAKRPELTLSNISRECDAERQILARASIIEVAGNPTITTAMFLFNNSLEKALKKSIDGL